ncbi:MAG: thiolase family protein [Acidimicrobiales bacterium]
MLATDPHLFRLPAEGEDRPLLLGSYAPESGLHFWPRRRRCPVTATPVEDVELGPVGTLYAIGDQMALTLFHVGTDDDGRELPVRGRAMSSKLSRRVFVVGIGMHPFGNEGIPATDMGYVAGVAALDDAGIDFPEVGALYNGYLGRGITAGVRLAKDLGLTGLPMTHVESASATGKSAFGEAVHAVAGGRVDVAMALGFDDMNRMAGVGRSGRRGLGAEDVMLPAALFTMWATRRMHEVGTTVETFAAVAAKNWNPARENPMAQRRADHEMTVEEVLASTMISYPPHLQDGVRGRRRRCRSHRGHRGGRPPTRRTDDRGGRLPAALGDLHRRSCVPRRGHRPGPDDPRHRLGRLRAGRARSSRPGPGAGPRCVPHRGTRLLRTARNMR